MKTDSTLETIIQLIAMNKSSVQVEQNTNVKREMERDVLKAIKLKCERQLTALDNEK